MPSFNILTALTAVAAALLSTTAAAAPVAELQPWKVTSLTTSSPSGRPGSAPFCRIFVNITDPNTFNLGETIFGEAVIGPSSTRCFLQWDCHADEPWNLVQRCSPTANGVWTFALVLPDSKDPTRPTEDFDLRFTLENKIIVNDAQKVTTKYVGQGHFALGIGGNMEGTCGGSGACSWGLNKNTVFPITQTVVD